MKNLQTDLVKNDEIMETDIPEVHDKENTKQDLLIKKLKELNQQEFHSSNEELFLEIKKNLAQEESLFDTEKKSFEERKNQVIKKVKKDYTESIKLKFSEQEEFLDELSEGNYLSPEKVSHLLQELPMVDGLSEEEIQRMHKVASEADLKENIEELFANIKNNTFGEKNPIITVIPKKLIVNGKEVVFNSNLIQIITKGKIKFYSNEENPPNMGHNNAWGSAWDSDFYPEYGDKTLADANERLATNINIDEDDSLFIASNGNIDEDKIDGDLLKKFYKNAMISFSEDGDYIYPLTYLSILKYLETGEFPQESFRIGHKVELFEEGEIRTIPCHRWRNLLDIAFLCLKAKKDANI